jgi:hypothetical protein
MIDDHLIINRWYYMIDDHLILNICVKYS